MVEAPSNLLLALYRSARELPIEQFQEFALRLVEPPSKHVREWHVLDTEDNAFPTVVADRARPKSLHATTLFAHVLMPHLVEALTINRSLHLHSVHGVVELCESLALCDSKGLVHYADAGFVEALASEWPGYDGGTLPEELTGQCLRGGQPRFVGRSIRVEARDGGEVSFLRARRKSRLDRLSPREREVARQFADGRNHKEIAKSMYLAPATVRHHLSGIYRKLEIHDKAQLAIMMRTVR